MNEKEYQDIEDAIKSAKLSAESEQLRGYQQEIDLQKEDASMITEQLDLGKELIRIDYLIRGYVLQFNEKTKTQEWVKPDDENMILLSPYGINLVREILSWYLNKNTLLSNYDEKTIDDIMYDFSSDLNDTCLMEYERIFRQPTVEKCIEVLKKRQEDKKKIKMFALELIGIEVNKQTEEQIEKKLREEIEPTIEKEIQKIKSQLMKDKLKRYFMFIRCIMDTVQNTYMRAWRGQERQTLRQHTHISENRGGFINRNDVGKDQFPFLRRR